MKIHLSLGSNSGNREYYLKNAVKALDNLKNTQVLKVSSIYETESWGNKQLDYFLNQVIMVTTELDCFELLNNCKDIEEMFGRVHGTGKWKARTLDIDILICDQKEIDTELLQVPHPLLSKRMFVLKPLSEIDPDCIIPGHNKKVVEVMKDCEDSSKVSLYKKRIS